MSTIANELAVTATDPMLTSGWFYTGNGLLNADQVTLLFQIKNLLCSTNLKMIKIKLCHQLFYCKLVKSFTELICLTTDFYFGFKDQPA